MMLWYRRDLQTVIRIQEDKLAFLSAMKRIRTAFYKRNDHIQRDAFDRKMLTLLDSKFKKKDCSSSQRQSHKRLKPPAAA